MEFEDYGDLFNWNRCLMEDDWNDGQHLTMKLKNKAKHHESATTFKVAEVKDGKHKLAAEEKMKLKMTELGGLEMEVKVKNSGAMSYEFESNCLQVSLISFD